MNLICSFPLFMIIASLFSGAVCLLLGKRAACAVSAALLSVLIVLDAVLLRYTRINGAFTYTMGEFPAPWGNEIRAGVLECFVLLIFLIVLLCSLAGGYHYLSRQVDDSKQNLFFSLLNLSSAAIVSLVMTNDIFTGYVFLEILTLASCGLMVATETGKATLAGVRYMIMNLLGSSLFLLGVVLLYGITGHLLMVPLRNSLAEIAADPSMILTLTLAIAVLTVGLAIKSGLFPFYSWMPDTYGWSTPTTAALMSSVVSKTYIFLLIKIYWRVIGPELFMQMPIRMILFLLGIAGMIFGSVSAIRSNDINRMVAYSSAAQIGYIYMCMGIGGTAGYTAAIFHLLCHAVTKSLLFLVTPRLVDVSGGSLIFRHIPGCALRDRISGLFFTAASLSMIGMPFFAGFTSKILITKAAADCGSNVIFFPAVLALAVSTALNALYFIRTVIRIYSNPDKEVSEYSAAHHSPAYLAAAWVLIACNLFLGLFPTITAGLIGQGFQMFM